MDECWYENISTNVHVNTIVNFTSVYFASNFFSPPCWLIVSFWQATILIWKYLEFAFFGSLTGQFITVSYNSMYKDGMFTKFNLKKFFP